MTHLSDTHARARKLKDLSDQRVRARVSKTNAFFFILVPPSPPATAWTLGVRVVTRPSSCHSSSRLSDTHACASKLKDSIDSFIPSFIHPAACPTRMPVHGNSKTSLINAYVQKFPTKSRFPFPYQVRFLGSPFEPQGPSFFPSFFPSRFWSFSEVIFVQKRLQNENQNPPNA